MTLSVELERARKHAQIKQWDEGEAVLAQSVANVPPAPELDAGEHAALAPFLAFCKEASVRHCPAKPHVIAAYTLIAHQRGVPASTIVEQLCAVGRLHDKFGLANPIATHVVQEVLRSIGGDQVAPPRSWPKADQAAFALAPRAIQAVVARREKDRERELRNCQNRAAEAERKLNEPKQKE
jgi:hypothetical protein